VRIILRRGWVRQRRFQSSGLTSIGEEAMHLSRLTTRS
jgi:hypothetical protein